MEGEDRGCQMRNDRQLGGDTAARNRANTDALRFIPADLNFIFIAGRATQRGQAPPPGRTTDQGLVFLTYA